MTLLQNVATVQESRVAKLTDAELQAARNYDSPEYERLCKHLGFESRCKFVRVTRAGCIGYTVGKPQEIRDLIETARFAGYRLDC